jgi:hypothetical protein
MACFGPARSSDPGFAHTESEDGADGVIGGLWEAFQEFLALRPDVVHPKNNLRFVTGRANDGRATYNLNQIYSAAGRAPREERSVHPQTTSRSRTAAFGRARRTKRGSSTSIGTMASSPAAGEVRRSRSWFGQRSHRGQMRPCTRLRSARSLIATRSPSSTSRVTTTLAGRTSAHVGPTASAASVRVSPSVRARRLVFDGVLSY